MGTTLNNYTETNGKSLDFCQMTSGLWDARNEIFIAAH